MDVKPILFNTEMVREILEGRKTVTRRVVKPQPEGRPVPMTKDSCWPWCFAIQGTEKVVRPPYQPGDILWVRETWQTKRGGGYLYKADTIGSFDLFITPEGRVVNYIPWRPSIHMPREAVRIFLRVTGVRVERLQEITESGTKAEGAVKSYPYTDPETGETAFMLDEKGTYLSGFSQIWDSTIKPKDLAAYGWDANPWVWVIEFERISKEEAKTS